MHVLIKYYWTCKCITLSGHFTKKQQYCITHLYINEFCMCQILPILSVIKETNINLMHNDVTSLGTPMPRNVGHCSHNQKNSEIVSHH